MAFEIPQHVKNQPFFASCVLKVSHQNNGRTQTQQVPDLHHTNCSFSYLCARMQSWSSTLEEKTLKMPLRVGLLPWTRRQRATQSNLLRQVCGCNLISGAARKYTKCDFWDRYHTLNLRRTRDNWMVRLDNVFVLFTIKSLLSLDILKTRYQSKIFYHCWCTYELNTTNTMPLVYSSDE